MLSESLWLLALKKTEQAIKKKSIIPFKTKLSILDQGKYKYELRTLIGKTKNQPNYKNLNQGPKINPFKPWDKDLEISNIKTNHILILNKYPVELGHMLLITKKWKPQNGWLDISDWNALVNVNIDTTGLWFFNNSELAGASQPHRHIQLLRRQTINLLFPRQMWFEDYLVNKINKESKLYKNTIVIPLLEDNSPEELQEAYYKSCIEMNIGEPNNDLKPKYGYNLLITNNWMALIRRSKECYQGFNINSLGFAGYFLITEGSNVPWLMNNNAESLLEGVI